MTQIILVRETFADSVKSDAVTFASLIVSVGFGVLLGSQTLQIIGGVMFLAFMFSKMASTYKNNVMTIAEARKRLDEIESEHLAK
jgi:divalent metal cation (Fe/Co/Zn/Cd) transporter